MRNLEDFAKFEVIDLKTIKTLRFHESLLEAEANMMKQGNMLRFFIFEKDNPFNVIGTFAFHHIQYLHHRNAVIGYKLDKEMRRRGYMKEALQKGMSLAFDDIELHRVEALVLPDNIPSMRLLESLGFAQEGLLKDKVMINGQWRDHYMYAKVNR